ncbi:MDR family MFS transporter [Candidatus Lokiarchaeum ossiferum]|uniref:MDR family MFS transporter n=1 Tax=Candidatus Lokiarchaeum ossiferum TaxID=2951803 RepID=UPI00352E64E0
MFKNLKNTYQKFPKTFWVLILATFIDQVGGALLFPFFAIYITDKFKVGMTEVGFLFSLFGIGSFFGNFIGGALTDKFGRKKMLLFGLVVSGLSSILMGVINDINWFYIVAGFMGLVGNAGGPAQQAMVADLLPPKNQPEGFGILRVMANLAVTIGPAIGGLLASRSYLLLFIADAVASSITAIIVFFVIPETKPQLSEDEPVKTVMETVGGYREVFKDWIFMFYVAITTLVSFVYMQMNSSLSVFLLQEYAFPITSFGLLISMNALMVVVLQFPVTHLISKFEPLKMIALGTVFYAIGFAMYGFVSTVPMFFIAMFVITLGEIIIAAFSQTLAASFAPEDKRGRYMAIFGYAHIFPTIFGVLLAGLIMDNMDSKLVWYFGGVIALIGAFSYLILLQLANRSKREILPEKNIIREQEESYDEVPRNY